MKTSQLNSEAKPTMINEIIQQLIDTKAKNKSAKPDLEKQYCAKFLAQQSEEFVLGYN
tara:strand:+ start:35 stop:208 length:174 start_codon:yes stop_codon:yes gene_type:complete